MTLLIKRSTQIKFDFILCSSVENVVDEHGVKPLYLYKTIPQFPIKTMGESKFLDCE